MLNKQN